MSRLLIVLALLGATFATGSPAAAAGAGGSRWQVQNPPFPLVRLQTAACPSAKVCVVAGQDTIFSTANGGVTWHHRRVHHGSQIVRVVCLSAVSCFALDEIVNGQAVTLADIQTRDGGRTWTDTSSLPQTFLVGTSCPTPTVCYALGGRTPGIGIDLWRSEDAGAHWTDLHGRPLSTGATQSLTCPGSALCYAGENGNVLVTANAGRTWSPRLFPTGRNTKRKPMPDLNVAGMSCLNANRCFLVTIGGRVYGTQDGWRTSRQLRAAGPSGHPAYTQILCPTASTCLVAGFVTTVLATTDGGRSWNALPTGASVPLLALACGSARFCVAIGDNTTIEITRDGGATWQSGHRQTNNSLSAISCIGVSTCTAVGVSGTIVGTSDGGKTWRTAASGVHQALDDVSCPSALVCYAVGGSRYAFAMNPYAFGRQDIGPVILRTGDGGTTWSILAQQPIAGRPLDLAGIACPTEERCFATSDTGAILSTVDGGTSWQWSRTGAYFQLHGIACPSAQTCIAVGGLDAECNDDGCDTPEEGAIFVTQDGGATWQKRFYQQGRLARNASTPAHLFAISCPAPATCFAAGHNVLVGTADGGQTWHVVTKHPFAPASGSPGDPAVALSCPSTSVCWATPGPPGLSHTGDGGLAWTPGPANPLGFNGRIAGVTCPALDTCYAVGVQGVILRLIGSSTR